MTQKLAADTATWEWNIGSYTVSNTVFIGYGLLVVADDYFGVRLQNFSYECEIWVLPDVVWS